jgi:hypothetical protein
MEQKNSDVSETVSVSIFWELAHLYIQVGMTKVSPKQMYDFFVTLVGTSVLPPDKHGNSTAASSKSLKSF